MGNIFVKDGNLVIKDLDSLVNPGHLIVKKGDIFSFISHLDASNPLSYPGTGNLWHNIAGSTNDVTFSNSVAWSSSEVGGYFTVTSNSYVANGTDEGLPTGTSPRAAFIWCKPTSLAGTYHAVFSYGDVSVVGDGFTVEIIRGKWAVTPTGIGYSALAPTTAKTNVWQHIAGTYDGTTLHLYINGVHVAEKTVELSTTLEGSLHVGWNGETSTANCFIGRIADVKFCSGLVSGDAVLNEYNSTKARFGL